MIGRIAEVGFEPQGTMMYAVVEPTNDIKNVKDVMVITSFKGQGSSLKSFEESLVQDQLEASKESNE